MAKKGTKIQIVDLGTHFVKAALCDVGDGPCTITKAAAVPLQGVASDAEGYLGELSTAFDGLADFFDRKIPVYFLANESLAHVGVSYLNNLAADQVDASIEADRQKFVSSAGAGQYDQVVHRSYKLREKAQNKNKQVVLANAYTKMEHMDQVFDLVNAKKLTWGGFYPRLFGYQELFKTAYGADKEASSAVACLVDVGFKSTTIVAFKDCNIVFHKVLHLGAYGIYQEMYNIDPKLQMDLFSLVAIMSNHGFSEDESTLTALGLPLPDPAKYIEVVQAEKDQLFTKVQLSIDYFSTVAATDFNTSMSTVMAVRKGPEKIIFTGGLSASPGFAEAAAQYFATSEILDPARICTMNANSTKTELSPSFFALAAAGAQLAVSAPPDYNLGDRYLKKGATSKTAAAAAAAGGSSGEPFAPTWAVLLAVVLYGAIGWHWNQLNTKFKRLQGTVSQTAQQVGTHDQLIVQWRDARRDEIQRRIRLEYIDELVKTRVDWGRVFNDLSSATPDGVKFFRFSTETALPTGPESTPTTGDPGADDKPKSITFKLCGEALRREGVSEFVQNLEKTKHFVKIGAPDITQVPEGSQPGGVCMDPEAQNVEWQKHFAFQITGSIVY